MKFLLLAALGFLCCAPAQARTEWCIFVGAPGELVYEERFYDWSRRLENSLIKDYGVGAESIHRIPLSAEEDPLTLESMEGALQVVTSTLGTEDTLVVVLLGHGSDEGVPKFMVKGPDLSAEALDRWLDATPTSRQLIINTTSSSGGFVATLSAPNRVIAAATQSGREKNAPEFAEHLVRALEEGRGDGDRNGHLSWGEWLAAGAADTADWYEQTGFIASEHAVIDDNGDGKGSRFPLDDGTDDGQLAASIYLEGALLMTEDSPYTEAIAEVEAWKDKKATVEGEEYWTQLEVLLLKAARLNPKLNDPAPTSP